MTEAAPTHSGRRGVADDHRGVAAEGDGAVAAGRSAVAGTGRDARDREVTP